MRSVELLPYFILSSVLHAALLPLVWSAGDLSATSLAMGGPARYALTVSIESLPSGASAGSLAPVTLMEDQAVSTRQSVLSSPLTESSYRVPAPPEKTLPRSSIHVATKHAAETSRTSERQAAPLSRSDKPPASPGADEGFGDSGNTSAMANGRGGERAGIGSSTADASLLGVSAEYPRLSRLRREEGRVVFRVMIERDGRVAAVDLVTSSGYELLDEAARRAVEAARFSPASSSGKLVGSAKLIAFRFKLQ